LRRHEILGEDRIVVDVDGREDCRHI
jgi:hypothetical protein